MTHRSSARAAALATILATAALASGCGPGGPVTAVPSVAPAGTPTAVPSDAPAGTPTAVPATQPAESSEPASPAADHPPGALLRGPGTGPDGVPGAEGTFQWDGLMSDSPWIVHPDALAVGAGPWQVTLDPPLATTGWTARWAPVEDGAAGDPVSRVEGTGSTILVEAPDVPGRWSLVVEAGFGPNREASWFWTLDVLP